ncbi:MAG TPA: peptidoglycan recognition family protein [Bryobacteraceae bacterium]|nr:peptidoglycan recognition family protein [Bryobacteraceae bacterium]
MRFIPRNFVGIFAGSLIERRAGQIQDPVQRLRYLQSNMGSVTGQPVLHASRSWWTKKLPVAGLALLALGFLIPKYKASAGAKASARETSAVASPVTRIAMAPGMETEVVPADTIPNVWLVDETHEFETYSNGLRIDDRYVKPNQKRIFYPVYQRGAIDATQPEWRSEPAGIVYHTTESDQARFTPDQNARLKRIGKAVIGVVQQNHSYHFLIDRFGQVFRIVPETDVANHAGYSVWAEGKSIFVNLNSSFLGIAFETQTQLGDMPSANPAQVHAARILTEMLRAKYHIPQSNCVTHAQVSVNPDNMLVGYHTDWAGNFPFHDIGLSDNYAMPPASIFAFGFDYDPAFVHATGVRLWQGLALAEDQMQTQAAARGIPVSRYRAILQKQYKEVLAALKAAATANDNHHET